MLGRQYSSSVARMAGLQYNRRAFTAGMASLLTSPLSLDLAHAQQIERSSLKLGVANRAHLYYLPVTIADRRGYFRDYGLTVTTSDFEGGGQAFDALLAGSVDVAAGAYEHTLRAQAMGQDVRAVIELGRFPGVVLAVGKDRPFKSIPDLKGRKIGVTAPSSSSQFFVLYLMAKAGLAPGDVSFVGVGGGERAVDAMKTGEIDAISNLDPVITRLQQDGAIRIVVDSRFPRVNYDIFGGTNPAAVLYGKQEFIAANPSRCRHWSTHSTRRCAGSRPQPRTRSWTPCRPSTFSVIVRSTSKRSKPTCLSIPEPGSSPAKGWAARSR
jgi:NitT/TauT family transport system substrate-binding protein